MADEHMFWEKTGETKFKGAYKTYLTKSFILPDGTKSDFDITTLKYGAFSMVMALTSDMKVIVAKQYRPGPEEIIYDMPAGVFNEGETPEQSIHRELREETGYETNQMIALNPDGNVVGPYDQAVGYFYLGLNCVLKHEQDLDDNENVEVELMPLKQYVNKALRKGLATHADCGWLAIDYMLQNKMITLEDISLD